MTHQELIAALETMRPAYDNLRAYQMQMDMDGCMVGVSRQALEEILDGIDSIRAINSKDET